MRRLCAQAAGFAVLAIGTVVYARGDEDQDKSSVDVDEVRYLCTLP